MRKKSILFVAGVATMYFQNLYAQENVSDSTRVSSLEEVVITGNANPKKKIESSIAVTTLKAADIQARAPQSTADILQYIPGFVAENSGGEVGNNLFARGIPSAGAYEYVQIQEDGLPIFEDGALQFANIDNFQRIDLTLGNMEAVRGGSAAVFATGAPGGIINFISKTGRNKFGGEFKLTTGTASQFRTDFNLGGALVEDKLFFNVGGFYRSDDGIRNPGFRANRGGQIKMNLNYKFENGSFAVYYKHLDDRNIFYQVTPFIKDGDGVKEYPGFSATRGTFASEEMAHLRVPQLNGGWFTANLEDGVHPVSNAYGAQLQYKLSDIVKVNNNSKYTTIVEDYNAIFAPSWMGGIVSQDQAASALNLDPATAEFTYVTGGGALLDATTKLKRADLWFIHKEMQNFANSLSFDFNFGDLKLNLGHYISNWSSDQYWNWNSFLVTASDKPRLVNAVDTATGTSATYHGISQITWLERASGIKGLVNAVNANVDWKIADKWNFNAGARYDFDRYNGYRDNAGDNNKWQSYNIGALDNNTADDHVTSISANPYTYWDYDVNELSYTAALNYKISSKMAVYLRQSHGFRAPIEEAFYDNANKLDELKPTKIDQTELGYSGRISKNVTLYGSLFLMNLKDIYYGDIVNNGQSEALTSSVQNYGLELESQMRFNKFHLAINGTIQNPTYTKFDSNPENVGNVARRIPKFFYIVRPDFDITKQINVYAKVAHFGDKYNDEGNTFNLKGFTTLDSGISYTLDHVRFGVDVTNITNTIGLTEGDGTWKDVADGDVVFGRSIFGTAFRASITLNF